MTVKEAAERLLELIQVSTEVDISDPVLPEDHEDQGAEFNLQYGEEVFFFSVTKGS